jgi:RNA polymerase sigma-70 factor (ECF subfamily)
MIKPQTKINYKLADGKRISLEVSIEVKHLLEQIDRQIRSQRRQDRRRHTEYIDGVTDTTIVLPQEDFADLVTRMDIYRELYVAIDSLSEIQRRRLRLYYFGWMTYRQIAEREGVGFMTVARSVTRGVDNLRKLLAS